MRFVIPIVILAALVFALLLLFGLVRITLAGDETCFSIPVEWYSPSGVAGCTLDGPTDGKASTYPGDVAAANWCTYPWTDCGSAQVQSHLTGATITVPIAMYCDCFWFSDRRLIDLTPDQVRALDLDPAAGIFAVTVTPLGVGSSAPETKLIPSLPNTALIP